MRRTSTTADRSRPRRAARASDLIRFFLQRQQAAHRLDVPGFARAIGVTPAAVHQWLRSEKRGISEAYWDAIARFFDFRTPEELIAAARRRHARRA